MESASEYCMRWLGTKAGVHVTTWMQWLTWRLAGRDGGTVEMTCTVTGRRFSCVLILTEEGVLVFAAAGVDGCTF